jgi:hypothetical protein
MEVNNQHCPIPAAISLGKEPRYILNRRLGGSQSHSGHFGEERNIFFLTGLEPQASSPESLYTDCDIPVGNY